MNRLTDSFSSAPWCFNGHAHTVLCSLLFQSPHVSYKRVQIDTPDNDFLDIDYTEGENQKPVVIIFHGLEGHSNRYYVTQLAKHLHQRGFTVVAPNFRSCGGTLNRTKKFYHSGEIEDLQTIIGWVNREFPNRAIHAAGFSLGASALLNYLKEHKTHHPLRSIVAISTPFDLKRGSINLEKGFNKIYSIRFLKTLAQKLREKKKTHPDLPDFNGSTIYEFDDQITAEIYGFDGADDYYHRCSSGLFMDQIQTSTLVIHSREDPICPFQWTPIDTIRKNPNLAECFTDQGGHVGFWSLPPGWLNKTVGDFISKN
jgi:predicted alpha/beta-fold hydrolase